MDNTACSPTSTGNEPAVASSTPATDDPHLDGGWRSSSGPIPGPRSGDDVDGHYRTNSTVPATSPTANPVLVLDN